MNLVKIKHSISHVFTVLMLILLALSIITAAINLFISINSLIPIGLFVSAVVSGLISQWIFKSNEQAHNQTVRLANSKIQEAINSINKRDE